MNTTKYTVEQTKIVVDYYWAGIINNDTTPELIIHEILKWCKEGPPSAKVTDIDIKKQDSKNEYDDFEIRY